MNTRTAFHARRRNSIGGSDAGAILGVSPYASALDVYLDKIGEAQRDVDSDWLRWGRMLEPLILDEYERTEGCTLDRDTFVVHPIHSWMHANLDGQRQDNGVIVDSKTVGSTTVDHWGEEGTDEVPVYVAAQMLHYMIVTGITLAHVAALFLSERKVRVYVVQYDADTAKNITRVEERFWNHVQRRVPPEHEHSNANAIKLYRKDNGTQRHASEEIAALCAQLRDLRHVEKRIDIARGELEGAIKYHMGEAAELLAPDDDHTLATWKTSRAKRFDSVALKADDPETWARYAKTTDTRRFLLK